MIKLMRGLVLAGLAGTASAGELDDLLRQVQESRTRESRVDAERKAHFLADKNQQQQLLNDTKAALAKAETESKALRAEFAANETRLTELNAELKKQTGDMEILFGAVREFSRKLSADIEGSLVSAQFPGRAPTFEALAKNKDNPGIAQLEDLWVGVLQEMTEAGKVSKFSAEVTNAAGEPRKTEVYRIGAFTAFADNKYLRYTPKTGKLVEMPQQPGREYLSMLKGLDAGTEPFIKVAIDPTRGAVLESVTHAHSAFTWLPKSLRGLVANEVDLGTFAVLLLASILAMAAAIERWLFYRRVDFSQYPSRAALETELTRHLTVIGTVAANAPFVGLLGTVLGIMLTFQTMGVEKNMDVHSIMIGLSTALKATAIGLVVAIPCVVMNNILRRRIRELVTAYEVQHGS